MTKVTYLLPSKAIVFSLFFFVLTIETAWTQCTNPVPTGASAQAFCKIDQPTISDLVATGGAIAWYNAPTGGVRLSDTQPLEDGSTFYADDVSNDGCSTSRLAVTVTIYGQEPDNVDVFVGKCATENATIAQLSADGQNIEWYTESTGGILLDPSHVLENGQTYWVQQTENGCTSLRLPTTVSLIDQPAPAVDAVQNFCTDAPVTVGSLSPSAANIVWYNSENSTEPLDFSEVLINGEDYWAATLNFPCESTERSQTTVFLETPPKPGTNGTLSFCEEVPTVENLFDLLGGTPETTGTWSGPSTLTNGHLGTFDSATNSEGVYTYTVSTGTGICPDAASTVTVIIQRTPPPTVSETTQTFCEIDVPTVADLTATGNSIVWYASETDATPLNPADPLVDGEDYWAAQTDSDTGCLSVSRTVVNVTITVVPPPTVSNPNQDFCTIENATIANLSISGTNVVWYDSELSTTPLATTDALVDGEDYWASEMGAAGCESASRVVISVAIVDVATPTTTNPTQEFCVVDTPTVADLQINEPNIVWYDAETGGNIVSADAVLTNGSTFWASQVVNSCESPSRLAITAVLNDIAAPTTAATTQTFCELDNPTIADLALNESSVVWYASATSTTVVPSSDPVTDGSSYWAAQLDPATGCESSERLQIAIVITSSAPPTSDIPNQLFCLVDNATVADLQANETNVYWYATASDTTPLDPAQALIDGAQYYGSFFDGPNSCEGTDRLLVTVTISDPQAPTSGNTNPTFCTLAAPTIALLEVNESTVLWYGSATDTTPLSTDTLLTDGGEYWAALNDPNTGCIGTERLKFTTTLEDPGTPVLAPNGAEFCGIDEPIVADLEDRISVSSGSTVLISDTPNGTPLSPGERLIDGQTYYALAENTGGCLSTTALEIKVDLSKCDMYDVKFFDGFSPNGDGVNDSYNILYINELYPDFEVRFFNRWGAEVYYMNASTPSWNGRLNGDGAFVPSGVYFYVAEFNKDGRKPVQGKLILNR